MDKTIKNQPAQVTLNQETRSLSRSILKISRLPAAPTFDWTSQAANALAILNPDTSFGIVIAQIDNNTKVCTIESSGVYISNPAQQSVEPGQARCILERMSSSPINLTETHANSGYIAPISTLFPQWVASKASLPWSSPHPAQSLAAYAPISNATHQDTSTTLALLMFASHDQPSTAPTDPSSLAAVLAVMTDKASMAIQPNNSGSILWLTEREQVILDLLILGNSVRSIAETIARSPHTVHDHVKNLHRKLDATSRGQLVTRALGHHDSSKKLQLLTPTIDSQLFHYSNPPTHNPETHIGISELKLTTPTPIPTNTTPPQQATPQQATPLNRTTNAP